MNKLDNLNKYRHWFWVAGLIGAIIFSRFLSPHSFENIVFPYQVQVALAIISVIGMIALVYLGYKLGKKLKTDI